MGGIFLAVVWGTWGVVVGLGITTLAFGLVRWKKRRHTGAK